MGIITNLIGMALDEKHRKRTEAHQQESQNISRQIGIYDTILRMPDDQLQPGVKESALENLMGLVGQHGGAVGKQVAPQLGTMMGTLVGGGRVANQMATGGGVGAMGISTNEEPNLSRPAGGPRAAQAPADAGAPSPATGAPVSLRPTGLLRSPEERAAYQEQQYQRAQQMKQREQLAEEQQEYEARQKRGEAIGLTGDALKRFAVTGSLPARFGEPEQPTATKLTAVEYPDGSIKQLEYDPKNHKFYNVAGKEIQVPEGAEFAEGKAPGALGQLARANKILADPNASEEDRDAAQAFKDKYTASTTSAKEADQEAEDIAGAIMRGEQDPTLTGLSRSGIAGKVRDKLAKEGYNLLRAQNDQYAVKRWLGTQNSQQQVRLRQATDFAMESLDLLDNRQNPGDDLIGQLRNQVPRSKFPVLNRAALTAAKGGAFGEAAASAATNLESQITDLQSELAVVYKGGNSPTDKGLESAQKMLSGDWSDQVLRNAIDLSRKNLGLRLNSIKRTGPAGLSGEGQQQYSGGADTKTPSGGGGKGAGGGAPKKDDRRSYQGADYVFDGTQWVRQ